MKKRLLSLIVVLITVLVLVIPMGAPVKAATSNLSLVLSVVPNSTYNGITAGYNISITNPNNVILGTVLNNATNVVVSFYPPGPNGLPVSVPTYVSAPFNLAAGGTTVSLPVQNVVLALNSGVTTATANAAFSATFNSTTIGPVTGSATIPLTIISPNTTVTITPSSPSVSGGGTESLIITEHNSGIGDISSPNVVLTSTPGTTIPTMPLTLLKASQYFVSGDTLNDGIISSGETWTWIVTGVVVNATTTFIANGDGIDSLGNHVNFNTAGGTTPGVPTEQALAAVSINMITVTAPNGGETWAVSSTHNITWTSVGFSGSVKIELSRDSGTTWTPIASPVPDTGSYAWTVSGPVTTSARVRITSISNPGVSGASAADFNIGQNIIVTSPNGGEILYLLSTPQNITWTSASFSGPMKIELSRDSGVTWNTIASPVPNTGSYSWTVTGTATTHARIRVSSIYFPSLFDTSDADFTIAAAVTSNITVTAPNGGETWAVSSTHNITWNSVAIGNSVKIEVSRDSGATWTTVAPHVLDTGSYAWTVSGPVTTNARVRITSISNPGVSGASAADFNIGQNIIVTSPNGGEIWSVLGTPRNITWTSTGFSGPVKIELSRDSGVTWNVIASPVPNSGSYTWVVHFPTAHARIRVSSIFFPTLFDTSDADFIIN